MRLTFFFSLLATSLLWAETLPPEVEARLTPEKLAAYAAPGDPALYASLQAQLEEPVESLGAPALDIKVPVKSFPSGQAETMVIAKKAWISLDMKNLRGRDVTVINYKEDGSVDTTLFADEVAIDRTTKRGLARGNVRLEQGTDTLTGKDARCDLDKKYVLILTNARISTSKLAGADFSKGGLFHK